MPSVAVVTLYDQTTTGEKSNPVRLTFASERITARELIERRVRAEVEAYNRSPGEYFRGLVAPAEAELAVNSYKLRKRKPLDVAEQCARAISAFERNAFFMLAGDRQIEDLDEVLVVTPGFEVQFVKLVPLVGG